ncbi:MAG TPA: VOC family protein [Acidimicrobiales bacterium]|jgi:PhnB protein
MTGSTGEITPIPEGYGTVTPRLVVSDGNAAIEFYRRAFGAEEVGERFCGPDGKIIHAEVRIGDSMVLLTDDSADGAPARSPEVLGGVTAIMSLYWVNVDEAWARATEAGCEVIFPLADQFYGERGGRLRDPFGQQWMMSQRIELLSPEEIRARVSGSGS